MLIRFSKLHREHQTKRNLSKASLSVTKPSSSKLSPLSKSRPMGEEEIALLNMTNQTDTAMSGRSQGKKKDPVVLEDDEEDSDEADDDDASSTSTEDDEVAGEREGVKEEKAEGRGLGKGKGTEKGKGGGKRGNGRKGKRRPEKSTSLDKVLTSLVGIAGGLAKKKTKATIEEKPLAEPSSEILRLQIQLEEKKIEAIKLQIELEKHKK